MMLKKAAAIILAAIMSLSAIALVGCGGKNAEPEIKTYTITFNYGDGSGDVMSIYIEEDAQIRELPEPTAVPNGMAFKGWQTQDNRLVSPGMAYTFDKDITLYAKYDAIPYTIEFDVNGGDSLIKNRETYTVDSAKVLPTPTRTGYEFLGWKGSATAESVKVLPAGRTGDITLTAEWKIKEFTITFDYNGGTGSEETRKVSYGEEIKELPTPVVPADKEFDGWRVESVDGELFINGTAYNFERDIILVAKYSDVTIEPTYYIGYNGEGSDLLPAETVTSYKVSETDISLPTPMRTGYEFLGWKESETSEPIKAIPAGTARNLNLTAAWEIIDYVITFDYNGGAGSENTRTVHYGDTVSGLPVPTSVPEYKEFEGWHVGSADGAAFTEGTAFAFDENVTLVAVYRPKKFTVIIINDTRADFTAWADGTTGSKTVEVEANTAIVMPAILYDFMDKNEKVNHDYDFSGWYYTDKDGKQRKLNTSVKFTLENLNIEGYEFTLKAKVYKQWLGPF